MDVVRALVWFRRDLRDHDHAALAAALRAAEHVYCAFVFDREILDALPSRSDRRVAFIHRSVVELDGALRKRGGSLVVVHDHARTAIPELARRLRVDAVFANRDYEPAARERDAAVADALSQANIRLHATKDHVLFEEDEILTGAGKPYTVFTPYRNAWRRALDASPPEPHRAGGRGVLAAAPWPQRVPALDEIGFEPVELAPSGVEAGMTGAQRTVERFVERLDDYAAARDFPARDATSRLSPHLRFGTVSVRALARTAQARMAHGPASGASKWLDELAWRDFFAQLLFHFPHVVAAPFRPEFEQVPWRADEPGFAAWRAGETGYPLVDAGMRELATTGWMHNRVRMVTASFLVKDLLVDWRRGERHFAQHLLDYELASNNGGWQWAASTGCDAQPWFRVFNPVTQSERFDPEGAYIRRFVPELTNVPVPHVHAPWRMPRSLQEHLGVVIERDYPAPIVEHEGARQRAIDAFAAVSAKARRLASR